MSSKAYSMTVSPNTKTCYIKFSTELHKETDISDILESFKDESVVLENYIFDLSELKYIGPSCHRAFATMQHVSRTRGGAVVVVIPPELTLKRRMMEDGLIRPAEICISLASVKDFVKGARLKLQAKT